MLSLEKRSEVVELLELLDEIIEQIEENDDGELSIALDVIMQGRDELQSLLDD